MQSKLILIFICSFNQLPAQKYNPEQETNKQNYLAEGKRIGKKFTNDFYPNYDKIHSLPEKLFVAKIDSVRHDYLFVLNKFKPGLDNHYYKEQQMEIKYYFDRLLTEYPGIYDTQIGRRSSSSTILNRLKSNLADFNKPALLTNSDFTDYVKAFLSLQIDLELKKPFYKSRDNQRLYAVWKLIPEFFSNARCALFWKCDYLYDHIDRDGIKNIENFYKVFKTTCKDTGYLNKINSIYRADSIGRTGHLIKAYKTIGSFSLNIHIFLPDSSINNNKHAAIVFFHGGSWSEGKPDWFFSECKEAAKKGWVACAVEYRTYGIYGTLPFAAVMDAKSSIRWLRQHAANYNIDTNRIVTSGNSAGGHLALCTALVENWNEKSDDLNFSAVPNVILVNSGVYDLTDRNTAWIRKNLKDKNLVKEISPCYLIKKNFPPALIIHGTNDQSVPYSTAKSFADEISKVDSNTFEFESLNGAGHFIWFDPKYSPEVLRLRGEFLTKLGY